MSLTEEVTFEKRLKTFQEEGRIRWEGSGSRADRGLGHIREETVSFFNP